MTDEGGRRNTGTWVWALCLVVLAACGPGANVSGGGSGGPTVHTVKVDLAGNGSVSSNPAGLDCGTICTATFDEGTAVTLSAKAADGWNFTGWRGACSGTGACVVVLESNANVTATFVAAGQLPPNPPPPTADECADLVPGSLPPPVVTATTDAPNDGPCLQGLSDDGDGTFLLGFVSDRGGLGKGSQYTFFRTQGTGVAPIVGAFTGAGTDAVETQISSQPSGFSQFLAITFDGRSSILNWSHDGALISSPEIVAANTSHKPSSAIGVDPSGGTAAVKTYFTDDKGWITTYQRFDKNGVAETGEVQVDTGEHRVGAVGIALSGHALILTSVGDPNWEARWVARDGSPISGPFTVQGPASPKFQFLLDGSLALEQAAPFRIGLVDDFTAPAANIVYRIEDGATVAGPLPDWLAPRAANQLYAARSGKAYATWGSGGQCGSDLEILAASSGKSCTCMKVPNLSASASIGRDGSLIVPHPPGTPGCSYDLYPKLLR